MFQNLNIHDTDIVDISQKIRVPAIKLFSMVIRYLKEMVLTDIQARVEIKMDEIGYVIPVPDLWCDNLRCMVRYAADKVIKAFCLTLSYTTNLTQMNLKKQLNKY